MPVRTSYKSTFCKRPHDVTKKLRVPDLNRICSEKCQESLLNCISSCSDDDVNCLSQCNRDEAACTIGKFMFTS